MKFYQVDETYEEKEKQNVELLRIEAKLKELPFFIKFSQIANIFNFSKKELCQKRHQISKLIRPYKFGSKLYVYKKSDMLNFLNIDLPSIESDPLKYLKSIKQKYFTRVEFIQTLCISYYTFVRSKKEIEKLVPPLVSAVRGQFYKKSDIIKFIECGGLDDN